MNSMPALMVGHKAEAIDDSDGYAGRLDVPGELARAEFDVSGSYSRTVDHHEADTCIEVAAAFVHASFLRNNP